MLLKLECQNACCEQFSVHLHNDAVRRLHFSRNAYFKNYDKKLTVITDSIEWIS